MIEPATAANTQRCEQLFHEGRRWDGHADRPGSILNEVQILEMEINLEARREIAGQNFFRLLIQTFASRESATERANHFFRIHAGLRAEDERFSDRGQVDRNNDLIGK